MDNQINSKTVDLEKEQVDLILLMESSMTPELLDAVQRAHKTKDDNDVQDSLIVSYEGTHHA